MEKIQAILSPLEVASAASSERGRKMACIFSRGRCRGRAKKYRPFFATLNLIENKYLEKFNCKQNFVLYIGVVIWRMSKEISKGPSESQGTTKQKTYYLKCDWGPCIAIILHNFTLLEPPLQTKPWHILFYTIATSYVVKIDKVFWKVFWNSEILKNLNF